jgi:hypothetical protein
MLPVPGEILVHPGQEVQALDVVARAEMPSRYRVIDLTRQLARPSVGMSEALLVAEGDSVQANQIVATFKGSLSFLQHPVRAPVAGHIAKIGPGWVLLETERITIEVQAFINGVIAQVVSNSGVIIEATGAVIEAACGFGGEAFGQLKRRVDSPFEALGANTIDESVSEAIVLGGRTVGEEALRKAEAWQVRGIIVGSIQASLLNLDPPVKVRVVATEGFGNIPMSRHAFSILTSLSRKEISIRGQTPNLIWGHDRQWAEKHPIILSTKTPKLARNNYAGFSTAKSTQEKSEAVVGSRVRITRGKLLGMNGIIDFIPSAPQATAAGIIAPGVNVKVNSEIHYIPWANLEQVD